MHIKRFIPLILFISVFIPLTLTSSPSIGWWNSGGYAAAAYSLGIPDPGGSILFIIIGKIFIILFFFLPAAKALVLVSVISTAFSSVIMYYSLLAIFDKIKYQVTPHIKVIASFLTSLSLPFLYSIWLESTSVQVYALGLLITSILFFCSIKIWFSDDENVKKQYFFLTAFLIGLDFTAHRLNTPFIPVFVLLFYPLRRQLKKISFWSTLVGLYLLGFSLNLYLLIRSPMNSAYAMDHVQNFSELWDWINMKRFGQSNFSMILDRQAPFWDYQVNHMYLRYFGWNFSGMQGEGTLFHNIYLSLLPLLFGIAGFIYTLIKNLKIWILLFTVFFFYSFGLIVYSNIREGFDLMREIDRLFIPSFYLFLCFAGIGFYFTINFLYKSFRRMKLASNAAIVVLTIVGFLILPLNIFITNLFECNKYGYTFPADFAYNMLEGCEPNAILFTNGDNDSYPLWYLQTVEGFRNDISVINLPLLNTDFYTEQLQKKYKLFPENSDVFNPAKFRPSLIDSAVTINIKNQSPDYIEIKYEGRNFGKKQGILPQDIALISILEKNGWKRPVCFAITASQDNMAGLSEYLGTTGLSQRLFPVKNDSIAFKLLEENLTGKYRFNNFNDRRIYSDKLTNQIYNNYRQLSNILSQYHLEKGNKTEAKRIMDVMEMKLPSWRWNK